MNNKILLDHVDIVTTHMCNNNCRYCIDKFVNTSDLVIENGTVDKFLAKIRKYHGGDESLEILLLGGEPTTLATEKLIQIADIIHSYGFSAMMSTNGILTEKIEDVMPYYDSIQITAKPGSKRIEFWRKYSDKVNMKLAMDQTMDMEKMQQFIKETEGYVRQSICMYFTPDFRELCTDREVWEFLDTLEWKRNGSYMYSFHNGVRYKKCIHGETNIIDEPTVPKVYPNGNYNKTWMHEELDDYLFGDWA